METPAPSNTPTRIAQVLFGVATDPGKVRPLNEDSYALPAGVSDDQIADKGLLLLVADGVGGHQAGEVASALAAHTAMSHYYADPNHDLAEALRAAVSAARTAIQHAQTESPEQADMGSTLVMAVIHGTQLIVANVGDSRCYRLRGSKIAQLSKDHSWVAEQVRAGVLTEDEAHNHVYRSILNRALGKANISGDPDIQTFDWQPADRLLLCSDGLWDALKDEQIATLLSISSGDVESIARGLVRMAKDADGSDNITAVVACGPEAQLNTAIPPALGLRTSSALWRWLPILLFILAILSGAVALLIRNGQFPTALAPAIFAPPLPLTVTPNTRVSTPSGVLSTTHSVPTPSGVGVPAVLSVTVTLSGEHVMVPTATPTPAVLATATLSPTQLPVRTDFVLCDQDGFNIRRNRCDTPAMTFATETQSLYAYWSKPVLPNGARITVIWLQNDTVLQTQFCVVKRRQCEADDVAPMWARLSALTPNATETPTPTSGRNRATAAPTQTQLTPSPTREGDITQPVLAEGRYHVQLLVNDELQYDETFEIGTGIKP